MFENHPCSALSGQQWTQTHFLEKRAQRAMGIIPGPPCFPDRYFMIEHVLFKNPVPQLYFFMQKEFK